MIATSIFESEGEAETHLENAALDSQILDSLELYRQTLFSFSQCVWLFQQI